MSNIDKRAKSAIRELIDDARSRRLGKLIITADEMEMLLDELEDKDAELQEYRKVASEPIGWTDEQELRSVEKDGCGYLFKANPVSPHADPRRVIMVYAGPKLATITERAEAAK